MLALGWAIALALAFLMGLGVAWVAFWLGGNIGHWAAYAFIGAGFVIETISRGLADRRRKA